MPLSITFRWLWLSCPFTFLQVWPERQGQAVLPQLTNGLCYQIWHTSRYWILLMRLHRGRMGVWPKVRFIGAICIFSTDEKYCRRCSVAVDLYTQSFVSPWSLRIMSRKAKNRSPLPWVTHLFIYSLFSVHDSPKAFLATLTPKIPDSIAQNIQKINWITAEGKTTT